MTTATRKRPRPPVSPDIVLARCMAYRLRKLAKALPPGRVERLTPAQMAALGDDLRRVGWCLASLAATATGAAPYWTPTAGPTGE